MEDQTILDTGNTDTGLSVSRESMQHLRTAGSWAKFLAILGFIGVGFMIIGGLIMLATGSALGDMGGMPFPPALLSLVYFIMAALYFMPLRYMWNFATNAQSAADMGSEVSLAHAIENLKSHYKFLGIAAVIVISLYIIVFIVAIVGGAAMFS